MVFLRVSECFRRLLGVFDISGYFCGFVGILGCNWGVFRRNIGVFSMISVVFLVVICIICVFMVF